MININDKIDDFFLLSTGDGGEVFRLSAAAGKIVVLYFYPKDDTPGCTLQGKDFSDKLPEFESAGAVVLGVSRDSINSHEKFRKKYGYVHHLLADTESTLCEYFGVLAEKKMFNKSYVGIVRSTFLIDANGCLAKEWRNIKDVSGHVEEVRAAVAKLAANSRD